MLRAHGLCRCRRRPGVARTRSPQTRPTPRIRRRLLPTCFSARFCCAAARATFVVRRGRAAAAVEAAVRISHHSPRSLIPTHADGHARQLFLQQHGRGGGGVCVPAHSIRLRLCKLDGQPAARVYHRLGVGAARPHVPGGGLLVGRVLVHGARRRRRAARRGRGRRADRHDSQCARRDGDSTVDVARGGRAVPEADDGAELRVRGTL